MQFDGLVCRDPLRGGRARYRHGGAALNLGLPAMAKDAAAGKCGGCQEFSENDARWSIILKRHAPCRARNIDIVASRRIFR
jgi:hypothetical protein